MTDLFERALALAFERFGTDGQSAPFALVVGETIECLTIITDRSDKAAYLGRRLVRGRSASATAYAIAIDAFVRRDGARLDAIIVEGAKRGESDARLVAQPYRLVRGAPERLGAPVFVGARPSELVDWDPHSLDWGPITPDVYVDAQKLAVYVVNHDLESAENVARTIRFLRARVRHHAPHLPEGSVQLVHYDDRGQSVTSRSRAVLADVADDVQVRFSSEGAA